MIRNTRPMTQSERRAYVAVTMLSITFVLLALHALLFVSKPGVLDLRTSGIACAVSYAGGVLLCARAFRAGVDAE